MREYKSYSSGLYTNAFGVSFLLLFFNYILFYKTNNDFILINSILISIVIISILFYRVWIGTCSIVFNEKNVSIRYTYTQKKEIVEYADIHEMKHLNVHKSNMNRIQIKYSNGNIQSKTTFKSIDEGNYLNFAKWIKSKNENIKLSVSSSDSKMNHKLQEEFGWKYRK